jgi:hypothetical protein
MTKPQQWLADFSVSASQVVVDGLVPVKGYHESGRPRRVAIMEKAAHYRADAVFFEAPRHGKAAIAQAFLYRSDGPEIDPDFGKLHQRLWSWGGVPLVYRCTNGKVQLFRCAHRPDFEINDKLNLNIQDIDVSRRIALTHGGMLNDPTQRSGMTGGVQKLCQAKKQHKRHLLMKVKAYTRNSIEKTSLPKPLRRRLLICR